MDLRRILFNKCFRRQSSVLVNYHVSKITPSSSKSWQKWSPCNERNEILLRSTLASILVLQSTAEMFLSSHQINNVEVFFHFVLSNITKSSNESCKEFLCQQKLRALQLVVSAKTVKNLTSQATKSVLKQGLFTTFSPCKEAVVLM